MDIKWKKFVSLYGIKFAILYVLGFFLLVNFYSRFEFQTFPADLLVVRETFTIYLPFGSAFAFAAFFIIILEVYKNLR